MPVDWAVILYYAAGLLALSRGLLGLFRPATRSYLAPSQPEAVPEQPGRPFSWVQLGLAGLACLVVGASLPLSGVIVPRRYPATASPEELLPELAAVDAGAVFQALAENAKYAGAGGAGHLPALLCRRRGRTEERQDRLRQHGPAAAWCSSWWGSRTAWW